MTEMSQRKEKHSGPKQSIAQRTNNVPKRFALLDLNDCVTFYFPD